MPEFQINSNLESMPLKLRQQTPQESHWMDKMSQCYVNTIHPPSAERASTQRSPQCMKVPTCFPIVHFARLDGCLGRSARLLTSFIAFVALRLPALNRNGFLPLVCLSVCSYHLLPMPQQVPDAVQRHCIYVSYDRLASCPGHNPALYCPGVD